MNVAILALVALVAVIALLLRGYMKANPAMLAWGLKTAGGIGAWAAAIALMTRGAVLPAIPIGLLGLWLLWGSKKRGKANRSSGTTSSLKTDHLDIMLDHDTGAVTGRVLKGMFANRRIENLKATELALLWQDCRYTDPPSAQIIEAYLDRVHPTWQADVARGEAEMASGPDGLMTEKEALAILGLEENASEEEVRQAHRELMKRFHPDRGGSTYLASKINEAKTTLLGE